MVYKLDNAELPTGFIPSLLHLMREAREAIIAGRYARFRARVENARGTARGLAAPADDER